MTLNFILNGHPTELEVSRTSACWISCERTWA